MSDIWPSNVTVTCEIGSQRGPAFEPPLSSYSDVINAFLQLGWQILNTYVEDQQPDLLENGDLVWWSERDGWAHLYRFAPDGSEAARLTQGPWAA